MTDMKCPYCNSELRTFILEEPAVWYCPNRCAPMLPPKIWRDLITSKKAQDALKEILYFFDAVCQKDEMYFYDLIDNNIKKYREIASITKQEE